MPITYGSVCSGIEAATQAWHPLGMRAAWFAEIEPFPSAVLAHHYPNVPNHGDMTKLAALVLAGKIPAPEVLVGGTPCQAFSVAGMREGLTDPRGALTIKYVELADAVDYVRAGQRKPPCVIVWENVPGVLSDKGNAFGCFLGALAGEDCELQPSGKKWPDAGCVYGPKRTIAWRILDAQYFGLAQRRRRVFVVASARDGFDPTEVLFEREGVRRDTAPRRGEGQDVTGSAPFGPALQCGCGYTFDESLGQYGCPNCEGGEGPAVGVFCGVPAFGGHALGGSVARSATLTAKDTRLDMESETFFVAPTIAYPIQNATRGKAQNGLGIGETADPMYTLDQASQHAVMVAELSPTLRSGNMRNNSNPMTEAEMLVGGSKVRRLIPRECERLQGMTDDYTLIPWRGKPASECPDGPRYKAIGNSKAVPCVRWIGRRILKQITPSPYG
ncbi:DNA cytosine methyltransferase [Pseudomonas sp. RSB 5.4]|uniref:DNA cytosine methyltransferase n=1 Tax=Pseudomonas sp. RSB 5.4 TaxID=3127459 RepID=UPI0030D23C05